jgi:cyclopropane fatty-acyl-phospholipid synthase-like methyltransferase
MEVSTTASANELWLPAEDGQPPAASANREITQIRRRRGHFLRTVQLWQEMLESNICFLVS